MSAPTLDGGAIWRRRGEIDRARREKMRDAMKDYDEQVHRPAYEALVKDCAAIGHKKGRDWNNGLGWHWWHCAWCGTRLEVTSIYDEPPTEEERRADEHAAMHDPR